MEFQQRYEFDPKKDLLGKGGFSKVYKATDTLLDRTVALKFFNGTTSHKYQVLNEIKKVIRFEHPNLCKYYDIAVLSNKNVVGETEEIEIGIMEYIDGGDFKTFTRKNPQHIDKLLIDVLKGLAYLHRHGIAHRDLKPENILIKTDEDEPVSKITDFGISKVIASDDANSSTLLGTIEYMAPEQFNPKKYGINGRITTNLDLWSFGLLVYEAVCHESFFGSRSGGISAEQVLANILSEASFAKADAIPEKYREIVKRCLVKNAADRVQNALDLISLFGYKTSPVDEVRTNQVHIHHEAVAEVTQIIHPKVPVEEETPTGDDTRAIHAEDTQVIGFGTEFYTEKTQVIETIPDITSEETQSIEQELDITAETQVIEPVLESETAEISHVSEPIANITEDQPKVSDSNKSESVEKGDTVNKHNEQLIRSKKEEAKTKRIKKIVLLTSLAVLLVIFFIAYPFLSNPYPTPEKKPDTVHTPLPPLVEHWKPEMIMISGGKFTMGDTGTDSLKAPLYAHEVVVSDFSLGKYEITVAQFKKFIEETRYQTTAQQKGSSKIFVEGRWRDSIGIDWRHDVRGNLINSNTTNIPVVHVSWTDANAYCEWLSQKTSETYRLPTEAEWEFAARNGKNSEPFSYSGSDSINQVAWYKENSGDSIHPIGTMQANGLGIFDMSGNALEWCNDWFDKDYYKKSPIQNPIGPDSPAKDSVKVLRGGAWAYEAKVSRVITRTKLNINVIGGSTGFRVCRVNK